MTLDLSSALTEVLTTGIPAVVGWLVIRSVNAMDKTIAALTGKVETLTTQHTQVLVDLAVLRERVDHVEAADHFEH